MCGISGIFASQPVDSLELRVSHMNSSLIHRGPDASGIKIFNSTVGLGHRRLSIIDASETANQPMSSANGRYSIVYNGEIYNFEEIKTELSLYPYRSRTDTEVILAAIEVNGLDWFLARANGMFAIALYDNEMKNLFLIRDRFGVKPLYYTVSDGRLVFCSEIKGILASGLYEARLNQGALDEYLAYRYVREPYSFFSDVFQLPSANYVKFDSELNSTFTQYWSLPEEFNTSQTYDEKKILALFEKQVMRAVSLRLVSDVPIGTYLSGGVDSSLISAIVAKKHPHLNTYSIGFKELNEFEYANIVAKQYDTQHHEIEVNSDVYLNIEDWKQLIRFRDSPLGVPNEIPLSILSKELRKQIIVVLSGEGADELLGGYGKIYRLGFEYKNRTTKQDFYDYFINRYEYVDRATRDKFLNVESDYRNEFDNKIKLKFKSLDNDEFIFRFFHDYHIKGLLHRLDATTMCYGVEGRVPFLDFELVEFAYKEIPYDLKLKWLDSQNQFEPKSLSANELSEQFDIPKYLLKKMAEAYLPQQIIYRKKMGFPVPLTCWYPRLADLARKYLAHAKWLKPDCVEDLILHLSGHERSGQLLWMFINLEMFLQEYFSKSYKW